METALNLISDENIYTCSECGEEKFAIDMRTYRGKPTTMCKSCYSKKLKAGREAKKINKERENLRKVYTNVSLSHFTPRELMDELKARGYHGELSYVTRIKL